MHSYDVCIVRRRETRESGQTVIPRVESHFGGRNAICVVLSSHEVASTSELLSPKPRVIHPSTKPIIRAKIVKMDVLDEHTSNEQPGYPISSLIQSGPIGCSHPSTTAQMPSNIPGANVRALLICVFTKLTIWRQNHDLFLEKRLTELRGARAFGSPKRL